MAKKRGESDEVRDFWASVEREVGESILVHVLGRYQRGESPPGPLWGVFYVTASALHFQHFAQSSWIVSMLNSSSTRKKTPQEQDITFTVPFHTVERVDFPLIVRGWKRFFGQQEELYTFERGGEEPFVLTVDNNAEAFRAVVSKVWSGHT